VTCSNQELKIALKYHLQLNGSFAQVRQKKGLLRGEGDPNGNIPKKGHI
jgi:hypothetical protein